MTDLAAILVLAFVVYAFGFLRGHHAVTANGIFVLAQMIMALGTLAILDPHRQVDVLYGYVITWTMVSYLVVSAAAIGVGLGLAPDVRRLRSFDGAGRDDVAIYRPGVAVAVGIALSCVVVLVYYVSVGHVALLHGLRSSLTGRVTDVAAWRLSSYAGDNYVFPGYVNQFKNHLLPALAAVAITSWVRSGRRRLPLAAALTGFCVFGLLGTAQRGAFIQCVAMLGVYLYFVCGRRFPRGIIVLAVGAAAAIVVTTVALNRTVSVDGTVSQRLVDAVTEFWVRMTRDQQVSAVAGFQYIHAQPVQWGHEWLRAAASVLPGSGGSDLPNRIFATMFGSMRGTSPPSIWGSIYHNFGWPGVVFFPALLAPAYVWISAKAHARRRRNTLELIGMSGVFVTLGLWVAGSPDSLLNSGLVVYVGLWLWGGASRPREERCPRTP